MPDADRSFGNEGEGREPAFLAGAEYNRKRKSHPRVKIKRERGKARIEREED